MDAGRPIVTDMEELHCRAFGVQISVRFNEPELRASVEAAALPPGWEAVPDGSCSEAVFILRKRDSHPEWPYTVSRRGEKRQALAPDAPTAVALLEDRIEWFLAAAARDWLFVHAGVVGWKGRAIILPGVSMAGKTTLVTALLRLGATYCSDELALISPDGHVTPYPRKLSIRKEGRLLGDRHCHQELQATLQETSLPIGMIAFLAYSVDSLWEVKSYPPQQALFDLFRNSLRPRSKSKLCLDAALKSLQSSIILAGTRGNADEAASRLVEILEAAVDQEKFNMECNYHAA